MNEFSVFIVLSLAFVRFVPHPPQHPVSFSTFSLPWFALAQCEILFFIYCSQQLLLLLSDLRDLASPVRTEDSSGDRWRFDVFSSLLVRAHTRFVLLYGIFMHIVCAFCLVFTSFFFNRGREYLSLCSKRMICAWRFLKMYYNQGRFLWHK